MLVKIVNSYNFTIKVEMTDNMCDSPNLQALALPTQLLIRFSILPRGKANKFSLFIIHT